MRMKGEYLVAIAVAGFLVWRWKESKDPDGRVLIEAYVTKNGVCYLVRQFEGGRSTSTEVASRFCL